MDADALIDEFYSRQKTKKAEDTAYSYTQVVREWAEWLETPARRTMTQMPEIAHRRNWRRPLQRISGSSSATSLITADSREGQSALGGGQSRHSTRNSRNCPRNASNCVTSKILQKTSISLIGRPSKLGRKKRRS